jgi:hypothetical protein
MLNLEKAVEMVFEVDATLAKYGYKVSDNDGQTLHADYDKFSYLTPNFWIRIEPKENPACGCNTQAA